MAHVLSILFNSDDDLVACRSRLEQLLECTFNEERDGGMIRYFVRILGLELVLFGDHGLENDRGIPFESFAYVLDIVPIQLKVDLKLVTELQFAAAKYIYELITKQLKWNSMYVDDLQHIIAVFPFLVQK